MVARGWGSGGLMVTRGWGSERRIVARLGGGPVDPGC